MNLSSLERRHISRTFNNHIHQILRGNHGWVEVTIEVTISCHLCDHICFIVFCVNCDSILLINVMK